MPRLAGSRWRAVAGLAFVSDGRSVQAVWAVAPMLQSNASECCFGARAFHAGERFSMDT